MKLLDVALGELIQLMQERKFMCYGAGLQGHRAMELVQDWNVQDSFIGFIDNNPAKRGTYIKGRDRDYEIRPLKESLDMLGDNEFILIASLYYKEMLDSISENEGERDIECVVLDYVTRRQNMISDYDHVIKESDVPLIPKKIHYTYFKENMPDELKRYVDGWYKLCPDYEIIHWNEDNYDVTKNKYMYQAYCNGAYANVSDYARLDIVYNEGGIYLDTDIELVKRPDELLYQHCFGISGCTFTLSTGDGFGAVAHHELIKTLRDYYDNVSSVNPDGTPDKTSCNVHQNYVMQKLGYKSNDKFQQVGGMNVYPVIMSGSTSVGLEYRVTDKTFWIHHGGVRWFDWK